ncbi:MAG: cupin domain-containing protein [Opitutae bacterium]|jgi:mannose-6-phosphate isomerase-like protein (cupin superfamily)|nr:cupin domain-containing protein [Opitutae bacterium]MBT5717324.1 cupin domain-containing protein [Opitutae bacterium]
MNEKKNYKVASFADLPSEPCPCGNTQRAFIEEPEQTASFHIVKISKDSRMHYHKKMTEIYYVLGGNGILEIDNDKILLKKGISVMIKPGCRHRAVGKLTLINVPIPAFDEDDEWFD